MILQALNRYYERLSEAPGEDIAPFGFSRQKIAFRVVLNDDGTLHEIQDYRQQDGKKLLPRMVQVCGNAKPSGSGINPCFLWDNPAYMLGYKRDDDNPERTQECFEAFRQRHLDVESQVDDPAFAAVCRFLAAWDPKSAGDHETLTDIGTGFGIFGIRGETGHHLYQRDAIRQWWDTQVGAASESGGNAVGQCLITGRQAPIARLHEPKIKGVRGGQSSGAAVVSFNLDAFDSYGKSQSVNAPVSEQAAFQYCTALNRLLADRSRCIQIGDTTAVFWTDRPTPVENILGIMFGNKTEDDSLNNEVQSTLQAISQGKYPGNFGPQETPFYILGLSPNAARISIRFWLVSTLGELVDHLHQHFEDLRMARSDRDPEFIMAWQIVRETVRDSKDIPPLLGGALMRSILTGGPYPQMLLSALVRRIRADRTIRHVRVSAIKACLNRDARLHRSSLQEIPVSLDPNRKETSYRLGRLFAELEKTQEDALAGINDTIKDRYFGAASATPGSVFPRLIRMSQHHLGKLDKPKKTYHEKRIQDICQSIDNFPGHLNLRDQGLFAIGYYHQRQDIFTRKTNTSNDTSEE